MADGEILIRTRIDLDKAKDDLKLLQAKAKSTAQQISALDKEIASIKGNTKLTEDLEKARAAARAAGEELDALNDRIYRDTKSGQGADPKDIAKSDRLVAALEKQEAKVAALNAAYEKQQQRLAGLATQRDQLSAQLEKEQQEVNGVADAYTNQARAQKSAEQAQKALSRFSSRLRRIVSGVLIFNLISAALRKLVQGLGSAISQTEGFQTALSKLKGAAATAAAPLVNALGGAVTWLINQLATAMAYVARFVSLLTGKSLASMQASAEAMASVGSAAGSTAQQVDKAAKSLAGFDEITTLAAPEEDSGSGSGTAASPDYGFVGTVAPLPDLLSQAIDSFKAGFAKALAAASSGLEGLLEEIGRCGQAWAAIWNDPAVQDASARFVTSLAGALGQLAGSMASIGLSLADSLFGGLERYLIGFAPYIRDRLVGLFDVGSDLAALAGNLAEAVATVFSSVGSEGGKALTAGLLGTAANALLGMAETLGSTLLMVLSPIFQPLIDNAGLLRDAFSDLFALVAPLFEGMAAGAAEFYAGLTAAYDLLQPIIDAVAGFVSDVLSVALTILNALLESLQVFSPVLEGIGEVLGYLAGGFTAALAVITALNAATAILSALWGALTAVGGALAAAVGLLTSPVALVIAAFAAAVAAGMALYRNWDAIRAAAATFVQAVADEFSAWVALMTEFLDGVSGYFSDTWANITLAIYAFLGTILAALQQWVQNVQADLSGFCSSVLAAWQTLQSGTVAVFTSIASAIGGIWEGIVSTIKGCVNSIIGFINGMISAIVGGVNSVFGVLNGINIDVPAFAREVLGTSKIGFSLPTLSAPQIPYLAQGAVIPPNREFLAVLGDQSHGTNVEAPLATIEQAVAGVMGDNIAAMMAGFEALRDELAALRGDVQGIRIGDETIGRMGNSYNHRLAMMQGG